MAENKRSNLVPHHSHHIVNSYDQDLASLTEAIINMGMLVRDLVCIAVQSLREIGTDYADVAKVTDLKINRYDTEIEQRATTILALRQPMAIDLRQAISALKLAVIMERMGDLAKNTAKRAAKVSIPLDGTTLAAIEEMIAIILTMLDDVLDAFKSNNDNKAMEVVSRDQNVDKIYDILMDKLTNDIINNPQNTHSITQIIFAVKNIERIGDYVTKIAKVTHYIITGERVEKK